ncbi:hypothetical protein D3C71_1367930 [compost metagenome]
MLGSDAQHADRAGLDHLHTLETGDEHEMDAARGHVLDRWCDTAIRHMGAGEAQIADEARGREMAQRTDAARGIGGTAGRGLRGSDQIRDRPDVRCGRNGEQQGHRADADHRREIALQIVGQVGLQAAHDHCVGRHLQEGVTVRLRARRCLGANHGAATCPVVDDDSLAEVGLHFFREGSGQDVAGATRREGHDEPEGTRRKGCLCQHGGRDTGGASRGQHSSRELVHGNLSHNFSPDWERCERGRRAAASAVALVALLTYFSSASNKSSAALPAARPAGQPA